MWYYIVLTFFIFASLLITRLNTPYHPNLLLKKYIIIKNPKIQLLTISKINPEDFNTNIPKKNQNKLLYLGMIFYILWALVFIFTLIMWLVVPDIPTEPFLFDDYLGYYISTLNQILPFKLWLTYGMFDISFLSLNIVKCNRDIKEKKVINIIWIITVIFFFALSFIAVGYIFASFFKGSFNLNLCL